MDTTSSVRLVGYVRVSTEEQALNGVSLGVQAERLRAYVELYGGTLVEVIEDAGVSAKTLHRPGLTRALALLDEGHVDGLVVAKLDRLTRSVRDLGNLLDNYFCAGKAALLSVGEQVDTRTAGGRLVLNMLASVSQWEREIVVERTRLALAHLRSRGAALGAAPFGFQRVESADGTPTLDPAPEEMLVVDEIRALRDHGLTLRDIATRLNEGARRTKRGGRWHASTVRGILSRAA